MEKSLNEDTYEKLKYETIKELVDHKISKKRTAKKLGISRRQVDRLIIKEFYITHLLILSSFL